MELDERADFSFNESHFSPQRHDYHLLGKPASVCGSLRPLAGLSDPGAFTQLLPPEPRCGSERFLFVFFPVGRLGHIGPPSVGRSAATSLLPRPLPLLDVEEVQVGTYTQQHDGGQHVVDQLPEFGFQVALSVPEYQDDRRATGQQDAHREEDVERPRMHGGEHERPDHSHQNHHRRKASYDHVDDPIPS